MCVCDWLHSNVFVHVLITILLQFFSSNLAQAEGGQEEGSCQVSGFKVEDIVKELRRGNALKCCVCGKPGGYVGCVVRCCRKAGHFPCLHQAGFHFCYGEQYQAHCPKHSPVQPPLRHQQTASDCSICLTPLSHSHCPELLYCPCCFTTFHRVCIQVSTGDVSVSAKVLEGLIGLVYFTWPIPRMDSLYCLHDGWMDVEL